MLIQHPVSIFHISPFSFLALLSCSFMSQFLINESVDSSKIIDSHEFVCFADLQKTNCPKEFGESEQESNNTKPPD